MSDATKDRSSEPQNEAPEHKSLFFKKIEHDTWEAWTWTAVGLAAAALVIWIVAFSKQGYVSVLCWGVGIPLTSFMAVPIILWGLVKTMLNPPIFRTSRSIGFVSVLAVAYIANTPYFVAPLSTEDWTSEHDYVLPFKGEWYTIAGGESLEESYLVTSPAMRFGYVFTKLTEDGERASGDALELKNYPCYGAPVLAPVDASVVSVVNASKDNVPGKSSQDNLLGNYLILRVDEQEDLIISGLKKDSVSVKVGEEVKQGDAIAACGNSGASLYPEIRVYLVKNSEKLVLTEGLPLSFSNFTVNGKERVVKGIPRGVEFHTDLENGQRVAPFTP